MGWICCPRSSQKVAVTKLEDHLGDPDIKGGSDIRVELQ
jgi:hypothetical protein